MVDEAALAGMTGSKGGPSLPLTCAAVSGFLDDGECSGMRKEPNRLPAVQRDCPAVEGHWLPCMDVQKYGDAAVLLALLHYNPPTVIGATK